jgi:hypothetical protein
MVAQITFFTLKLIYFFYLSTHLHILKVCFSRTEKPILPQQSLHF